MPTILLIDDDPTIQLILKKTLQKEGYDVTVTNNGADGIIQAIKLRPALILCDWMMPVVDGLEVCRQIKVNPDLSTTFFVLLTSKGEIEDRVKGLDAGADDFVSKPIEMNELKARVRAGLRLYQLNQDLHSKTQALQSLNQKLQAELDEAADYVRSLLPSNISGKIHIQSLFKPSAKLGGDCFDYYWLDSENLAIYLLDVSGHGVGSALLSVAVLNVLRSQGLPNTNFYQPCAVLNALNRAFQMSNDKYFTIWYGVYNQTKRELIYSNAGHPPAIMLSGNFPGDIEVQKLGSPGLPIGILPEGDFEDESSLIPENSNLFIFSDGAYEIRQSNDKVWTLNEFIHLLTEFCLENSPQLEDLLPRIQQVTATNTFEDDLSLLKFKFQ